MNYAFHPEALAEYEAAAAYDAECQPGLEQRFMGAIEDAIRRVVDHPTQHPRIHGPVRRCLVSVFPYALLYRIEPETGCVRILAVMHGHRHPGYWKSRHS